MYRDGYTAGHMAGRKKGEKDAQENPDNVVELVDPRKPKNIARSLSRWSAQNLLIPPGHKKAGRPMRLPRFVRLWLEDSFKPGILESGLFVPRKNAKSAACAMLCLGFLSETSPLRQLGFRIGVISLNREKSGELQKQVGAIGKASGLDGIDYLQNRTESAWCTVEYLAAEKNAAHASGFDIVIVDEMGLMTKPNHVDLVAGALTSLSAKDGRLLAISIRGASDLVEDMIERHKVKQNRKHLVVHMYAAPQDCALDDKEAWKAANPGLGAIKQVSYMYRAAQKAKSSPAFENHFRAFDLNQPLDPRQETIITVAQWKNYIEVPRGKIPPREGRCWIGLDIGGKREHDVCSSLLGIKTLGSLRRISR